MNLVESSKCPTVLLKADTGADVNLMNSNTIDSLFDRNRKILQPSSLRMEKYGNSAVEVLGKFHAFLRWKGRVYRQLFYVTIANNSPNLLLRDGCYALGVIRPCYSVESTEIPRSSKQMKKWHPDSIQSPQREQKSKVIHSLIVKIKEPSQKTDQVPPDTEL